MRPDAGLEIRAREIHLWTSGRASPEGTPTLADLPSNCIQ